MSEIVFILGTFRRGGAERVISILANDYAERGWKVTVLLLLDNSIGYKVNKNIEFIDLTAGGYSSSMLRKLLRIPYWVWMIRKCICTKNPKNILAFTGNIATLTLVSLLGTNRKIIVSERIDPKQRKKFFLEALLRNRTWGGIHCKAIVFQTEYAKKCYPIPIMKKSIVIGNPVEINSERKDEVRKIVSVGRLSTQKNHELLIRAFYHINKKHKDFKLIIYGEGPLRDDLESLIEELHLESAVYLPGNVLDIHEQIADAMIFVLPSRFEGLSNALLEAMILGLPCVVSNINGIEEVIEDGRNGLIFQSDSIDDLVEKIDFLICNKNMRDWLSENGKKIKERYGKDNIMKEWFEILDNDK